MYIVTLSTHYRREYDSRRFLLFFLLLFSVFYFTFFTIHENKSVYQPSRVEDLPWDREQQFIWFGKEKKYYTIRTRSLAFFDACETHSTDTTGLLLKIRNIHNIYSFATWRTKPEFYQIRVIAA